ncbi:MAG: hypothetical protein LBS30_06840, partial [Planctomycetota bacterium]|nr:hypothetical protein [Planctomycetota bacterium]
MLSNIDPVTNATANAGATQAPRRGDADQILKAYNTIPPARVDEKRVAEEAESVGAETNKAHSADEVNRAGQVKARSSTTEIAKRSGDQAAIAFQLTREERDVFLEYVTGEDDPDSLTDQEQLTLQRVTERLAKLIEEADARSVKGRGRVNVAIKEWFSRLSGGK